MEVQVEAAAETSKLPLMEVLAVEVREMVGVAEVVDTVAVEVAPIQDLELRHLIVIVAEVADPFSRPRHRMP